MKAGLERRFSCFLNPSEARFSPLAAAACFLDPSVAGGTLIENSDDGVQEEILKEAEKYILSACTSTPATQRGDELGRDDGDQSRDVEEVLPNRPRLRFSATKLSSSQQSKQPKANSAQQDLRKYKDELLSQQIPDFEHHRTQWCM